jgi:glucosamine-phosphate N-acetyltransferase
VLQTKIAISDLNGQDLTRGFLEALETLAPVRLTHAEAVEVLRQRLRAGIHTYVARVGGRVAGTVTLLVEDKFIHSGGRVGHIEDVAVHPDFQKQGIGAALVRHATEKAKDFGCYKAILNCHDHLIPFYERLGYRQYDTGMRIDLRE